jgi:hypothetical protein
VKWVAPTAGFVGLLFVGAAALSWLLLFPRSAQGGAPAWLVLGLTIFCLVQGVILLGLAVRLGRQRRTRNDW